MSDGIKSAFPTSIKPMLCTLVAEPFNKDGWLYEVKWDGYRIVAYKHKNLVTIRSRSGLDYSERYTVITNALKKMKGDFVIDGEVVAFDEEGRVTFDLVQKANPDAPVAYYVFDVLWKDGYDAKQLPLRERKNILKKMLPSESIIKFSDDFEDGVALYEQAQKLEFEGVVAKKEDSVYQEGKRSNDWLKIPTAKRQEFVIGAWAESTKARSFRSLLFGAYNKEKQFEWIGRSGGGFNENEMPAILKKLKVLEIKESPFINKILDTKGAVIHFVKPELVANFKFAAWTESGRIRKPATFLGFRYDKKAKDVVREVPLPLSEEDTVIDRSVQKQVHKNYTKKPQDSKKKLQTAADSNWPKLEKIQVTSSSDFEVDDCTIKLTNVDRELWKSITKADLIMYYNTVAEYVLPHLINRPLSLHIKPYGPTAEGLYIKDMEGRQPECADIFSTKRKHPKAGKRSSIDYIVCNNKATLLWLINLGCIDINPWTSTIADYLHPNYIVIDLDPSDNDFKKAITTAQAAKHFFDEHKLKAFIKTSGKTGIHIFLPCKDFGFPQARLIAENICSEVQKLVPSITTTDVSINKRANKLYIDPNQNDEADTVACAYSCRPFHLPTVSTPLNWNEIKDALDAQQFTIKTILKRIEKKGDLFAEANGEKCKLTNSRLLKNFI